jgi:hypothetical protein
MGIRDRPIAPRSPWQNGYAERAIGSIRRECLDHLIVRSEAHLRRVLDRYAAYYNLTRTHLAIHKDTDIAGRSSAAAASSLAPFSVAFTINIAGCSFRKGQVHEATASPIAAEALRRIAELYAVEDTIRGQTAAARQVARHAKSLPLVEVMKPWLEAELVRVPPRSPLAEAIRPIALGRKNHLFAGSDGGAQRWATVASLIATAKLNGVEPFAYLKDVLERMSNGHPMRRIDELLPWNWKPSDRVN